MARRYFNWKLLVVILLATMMLGFTAFGLRKWQKGEKSELAYKKGIKAFDEHEWDVAAANIGRYISSNPEDIEMLHKYATAQLNIRPRSKSNAQQAIGAYRMILRADKSDIEATKKISEIYLQIRLPGEAELILKKFPDIASNPELGTLLARAMSAQKKYDAAAKTLNEILKAHPEHIQAYAVLAQLAAAQPEIVTKPMEYWLDMAVEKNSGSVKAYLMRANYRLRLGNIEGFDTDLSKVREMEIAEVGDKLVFARLLVISKKLDEAEKILQEVASDEPENNGLWSLWVDIAKRRNLNEKVLEVVNNAQEALERDPWDFMPIATEVYLQCGQLDKAKECISRLKEKKMNPLMLAQFEAMLTDLEGDPFEAIKAWREVIGLIFRTEGFSVPPKVRMSLALAYFRANDSGSAVRELTELLVDNPDYWQANLILARNASEKGNFVQAVDHAGKVLQAVPKHPEANSISLSARLQQMAVAGDEVSPSDVEALEKQIEELQKIPSMAIPAQMLKFRVAIGKADFQKAQKIAEKLKADHPDDIRSSMVIADLYAVQKKTDETIAVLEQTIKNFPKSPEPVQFLVSILANRNEQEKCVELVSQAIEKNDDSVRKLELSLLLADLYLKWNKQDELYGLLDRLAAAHPKEMKIKTRLLLTQKLTQSPDVAKKIVDDIGGIAGKESWQWRYYQSRVWYLSEDFKDRYTEIVSLLKKNLLENPTDQASRLLLAGAYFKNGDVQLAFSMYHEAYDRDPDNINVILPMVSALHKANQFEVADEILSKVSAKTLKNSELSSLKARAHIRQGDYSTASDLLRNSILANASSNSDKLTLAMLEMEQKNYSEAANMLENLKSNVTEPGFLRSVVNGQVQLSLRQNNNDEAIRICDKLVEDDPAAASLLIRARTYYMIKNNEKALSDYNLALEKEPENPAVWEARSRFYSTTDQIQKAVDDMVKALAVAKSNLAEAFSVVESIKKTAEDKSDALSDAETDVKKKQNVFLQIQRQTILLQLSSGIEGEVENARKLLAEGLKENPEDVDFMMINARLLYSRGTGPSVKESESVLKEITRKDPYNIEAWNLLGQIALNRGQHDRAITYAQRGLLSRPNDRSLMLLKARGEFGRSPAFAIATLKALYDLDNTILDNAVYLADAYSLSGQTRKAIALVKAQLDKIEDTRQSLRCRVALAQARYRDGQLEQAGKDFVDLMDSKEISTVALGTYTRLLAKDKKFDECFTKISEWIAKYPKDSLQAIGVVESLVNNYTANPQVMKLSVDTLDEILKLNPDSTNALQAIAVIYQMAGQNAKAITYYEKIHEINPEDVIVLNNLAWAYCQIEGDYKKALEMANRGLEKAPEYIDLIDTRGFIYNKLGQFEKAVVDFKKCLELYPSANPAVISTRLHLAKAYKKSGQKELAIKELNEILLLKQDMDENARKLKETDLSEAMDLLNTLSKRG